MPGKPHGSLPPVKCVCQQKQAAEIPSRNSERKYILKETVGIAGYGLYIPDGRMTAGEISAATSGIWSEEAVREKLGIKQDEFDNFSQTSISRLEKRKDIRISTLIEYLDNLGMGLEIKTFPKKNVKKIKEEVLLRI